MITEDKWEWDGFAKHFCGSRHCEFTMSTKIGDFVISTVGAYNVPDYVGKSIIQPSKENKAWDSIGYDRWFETFVFKAEKADCPCCEWVANTSGGELDSLCHETADEARKGHMEMCYRIAKGELDEQIEKEKGADIQQ